MHTSEDLPAITAGIREARALLDHHSAAALECAKLIGRLLSAAKAADEYGYAYLLHQLRIDRGTARQWIALARRQHQKESRRPAQPSASS